MAAPRFPWPVVLAAATTTATAAAPSGFDRYCNARFGHCVDVPASLRAVTDPANGDGRVFRSRDERVELRTFGSNGPAALDLDARGVYAQQLGFLKRDKLRVTYSALRNDAFVISGFAPDGRVYYQKSVVRGGTEYTVTLLYPSGAKATWDKLAARVAASFKAP